MSKQREKKIEKLLALFLGTTVVIDGSPVEKVVFSEVTGEGENQVVCLSWREKGLSFQVKLTEDGLANADILTKSLDLEDHEGDPITLEFLKDGKPISLAT